MKLSICIPTFNRTECLNNCLNSILIAKKNYNLNFEVCVSDNCSSIDISPMIKKYRKFYNINFKKNKKNLGVGVNILKAVSLAKGEFVWILGNDDLVMPYSFRYIDLLFKKNKNVNFFYINSFHLDSSIVLKGKQPFNTYNLPKNMNKFSSFPKSFKGKFLDLVDHKISFDFMLGMFLAIFKKKNWDKSLYKINQKFLFDRKTYATFENTAPHIIIWSSGFKNADAYFQSKPLSVNTYGVREWVNLYPLIESIRIPEALDYYREAGLSFYKFFYYKNYALRYFFISLIKIYFIKNFKGSKYINMKKHIICKLIYPNIYFGFIFYLIKKVYKLIFITNKSQ
jgi:glycosyltransferase involved in cell wall biosynthesis